MLGQVSLDAGLIQRKLVPVGGGRCADVLAVLVVQVAVTATQAGHGRLGAGAIDTVGAAGIGVWSPL